MSTYKFYNCTYEHTGITSWQLQDENNDIITLSTDELRESIENNSIKVKDIVLYNDMPLHIHTNIDKSGYELDAIQCSIMICGSKVIMPYSHIYKYCGGILKINNGVYTVNLLINKLNFFNEHISKYIDNDKVVYNPTKIVLQDIDDSTVLVLAYLRSGDQSSNVIKSIDKISQFYNISERNIDYNEYTGNIDIIEDEFDDIYYISADGGDIFTAELNETITKYDLATNSDIDNIIYSLKDAIEKLKTVYSINDEDITITTTGIDDGLLVTNRKAAKLNDIKLFQTYEQVDKIKNTIQYIEDNRDSINNMLSKLGIKEKLLGIEMTKTFYINGETMYDLSRLPINGNERLINIIEDNLNIEISTEPHMLRLKTQISSLAIHSASSSNVGNYSNIANYRNIDWVPVVNIHRLGEVVYEGIVYIDKVLYLVISEVDYDNELHLVKIEV